MTWKRPQPDTWVTGAVVDRSGLAQYVHLMRQPGDPERSPRKGRDHPDYEPQPHLRLRKRPVEEYEQAILAHLADGEARTFNRIGVELLDKTADVLATTPVNDALWNLVEREQIEHTLDAPILFRVRKVGDDG